MNDLLATTTEFNYPLYEYYQRDVRYAHALPKPRFYSDAQFKQLLHDEALSSTSRTQSTSDMSDNAYAFMPSPVETAVSRPTYYIPAETNKPYICTHCGKGINIIIIN